MPPATVRRPRPIGAAVARQRVYGSDDRQVLAMLLLPFVLVAFAAGFSQSLRNGARLPDPAGTAATDHASSPTRPALPRLVALAPSTAQPPNVQSITPALSFVPQSSSPPDPAPSSSAATSLGPSASDTALVSPSHSVSTPVAVVVPPPAIAATADTFAVPPVSATAPLSAALTPATEVAVLAVPEPATPVQESAPIPPATANNVCFAPQRDSAKSSTPAAIAAPRDPAAFGVALAAAALVQTREFVVYNDKYRRIAYPMGDVPSIYGVCTDVLIRAYRALSIDLQALVQQTRTGSGDPNIDHRRVDTLRRFFAAHGQSIPITEYAENYRPGDIVSYWRPQNRHSRTHIAIVANEIGPSGRPMIIHNRGWGPQLEDGLFVDQITGHYRFTGLRAVSPPLGPPLRRSTFKSVAGEKPIRPENVSRSAGVPKTVTAGAATR